MTAHAVCRRCVESILREEGAGPVPGYDISIEKHAHIVCVPGTELHIMRDHEDVHAIFPEPVQDGGKFLLKDN